MILRTDPAQGHAGRHRFRLDGSDDGHSVRTLSRARWYAGTGGSHRCTTWLLIWIADPHDPAGTAPVLTTDGSWKAHTLHSGGEARGGVLVQEGRTTSPGVILRDGRRRSVGLGGLELDRRGCRRAAGRGIAEGVAGTGALPKDSWIGVEAHHAGASGSPTGRMAPISRGISLGGTPPKPRSGPREAMVAGGPPWRSAEDRLATGRPAR